MKHPVQCLSLSIGLRVLASPAPAHVPGSTGPEPQAPALAARWVVGYFLAAVERDGLSVLGVRIGPARLVPRRVKTVYDLGTRESTHEVYAEVRPPIPVPSEQDCEVRGVSVLRDPFSRILESSAHVWCE